jgi:thioredoxin 1
MICKVDVDEERELANMFNISSIPTIIVFKNGKAERQALGYRTKEQLLNMMKF